MNFAITLSNDSRISLRRTLREACDQQRRLVCMFVQQGNMDGAKTASEELTSLENALEAIRAAVEIESVTL